MKIYIKRWCKNGLSEYAKFKAHQSVATESFNYYLENMVPFWLPSLKETGKIFLVTDKAGKIIQKWLYYHSQWNLAENFLVWDKESKKFRY